MQREHISNKNKKIPKISIGLPVYNSEKYLAETLDSLLAQTFTDFELIISDDCSTDGTKEICKIYMKKDGRIRCIFHSKNMGMAANQNFVLGEAQGKYFMWAAHDDLWDKNFIRTLFDSLEANEACATAFSPHVFTDEFGRIIGQVMRWDYASRSRLIRLLKFCIHHSDAFFYGLHRTQILKKTKVPVWWSINSITPVNSNYPVLFYLLSSGGYSLAGVSPLWFNRLKKPTYKTSIFQRRELDFLAFILRKFNLLYESTKDVYLGSNSLLLTLAILPAIAIRCSYDCCKPIVAYTKGLIRKNPNIRPHIPH